MADYFYNPTIQNIAMVKNDTMSFGFQLQGLEGQTPTEIYFTVKDNPSDTAYLFQRVIGNGVDLKEYDPVSDTYTYTVRIAPEDTENLEIGRYFYDLEIHVNKDTYTLLKGVITIDWEVTAKVNEDPTPPSEDGDNKYYPVGDPEGQLKYTELYISDIAQGILDINDAETTYRVSDMVSALSAIRDELDDISDAINIKLDQSTSNIIPLAQMAAAIAGIPSGVQLVDWVENILVNVLGISNPTVRGIYFEFANSNYKVSIGANDFQIQISISSFIRGGANVTGKFIFPYGGFSPTINGSIDLNGQDKKYPLDSTQCAERYNSGFNLDFNGGVNISNPTRATLINPNPGSMLPVFITKLGNGRFDNFSNVINSLLPKDLFRFILASGVSLSDIKGAMIYNDLAWGTAYCFYISDFPTVNVANNQYNYKPNYWTGFNGVGNFITIRDVNMDYYDNTDQAINWSDISVLNSRVYFNTFDILDENGDVYLAANCTLEDFYYIEHIQ